MRPTDRPRPARDAAGRGSRTGGTTLWTFTAGARGSRVVVYERERGGVLWARTWDPTLCGTGNYRRVSLRHRNKALARSYAMEQASRLEQGSTELLAGKITLAQFFGLYLTHHSPRKTRDEQGEDRRRVELWTRVLGAEKDRHKIIRRELEAFVDTRRSGAIDARAGRRPRRRRRGQYGRGPSRRMFIGCGGSANNGAWRSPVARLLWETQPRTRRHPPRMMRKELALTATRWHSPSTGPIVT